MKTSDFLKKDQLHHAYVLIGDKDTFINKIESFLEEDLGIETRGNPNVWSGEFDTFGIDESRELNQMHLLKPLSEDRKFFLVSFNFITIEAQNSLLKMFEDPVANTHFFIFAPYLNIFLPTLRSRLFIIEDKSLSESSIDIEKFLKANIKEKNNVLADIIKNKDKNEALIFLSALERELSKKDTNKYRFALAEILKAKAYLRDRAPSVKMLLEHVVNIV